MSNIIKIQSISSSDITVTINWSKAGRNQTAMSAAIVVDGDINQQWLEDVVTLDRSGNTTVESLHATVLLERRYDAIKIIINDLLEELELAAMEMDGRVKYSESALSTYYSYAKP